MGSIQKPNLNEVPFLGYLEDPNINMNFSPSQFTYAEGEYPKDAVELAFFNKTLQYINSGGYGIEPRDRQLLWDRAKDNAFTAARTAMDTVAAEMSSHGYSLPTGAFLKRQDVTMIGVQKAISDQMRDITIKESDMYVANYQFTHQKAMDLTNMARTFYAARMERKLKALELQLQAEVQFYNIYVTVYNLKAAKFKMMIEIFTANLQNRDISAKIYGEMIQAEKTKVDANSALVQQYTAQIEVGKIRAEIYNAQVNAFRATIEADAVKAQIYKTSAEMTLLNVQLKEIEYKVYSASITVESAKVEAYKAEIQAYTAEVEGTKATIQADIEYFRGQILEINGQVEVYKAQITYYEAQLQTITEGYRGQMLGFNGQVEAYKGQVTSFEAQVKNSELGSQLSATTHNAAIELAKMRSQIQADTYRSYVAGFEQQVRSHQEKNAVEGAKYDGEIKKFVANAQSQTESHKTQVAGYEGQLRNWGLEMQAYAEDFRSQVQLADASTRGYAAVAGLATQGLDTQYRTAVLTMEANSKTVELQLKKTVETIDATIKGFVPMLDIYKQIATAALSSLHMSAGVSSSSSTGASLSYGYSWGKHEEIPAGGSMQIDSIQLPTTVGQLG